MNTSGSQTIRNPLTMQGACPLKRSLSSTANRLNKRFGKSFRILKGIEADILRDGSLDYPTRVLSTFDFVAASVHSRFKMPKKE